MHYEIALGVFSGSLWKIVGQTSAFGVFILLILLFMSVVSWMIIFYKWREFKSAETDTTSFLQHFRRTNQLAEAAGQAKSYKTSPMARIFLSGFEETNSLKKIRNEAVGLQDNVRPLEQEDFDIVEMSMERTLTDEINRLERKVVFLASTGSSAPFLGLLGTVVGIMDSFWAIGERGSASLAVVAPGIAEALLATIVGLGTAIPAVIAFNWANNKLKNMNDRGAGFILEYVARARKEAR